MPRRVVLPQLVFLQCWEWEGHGQPHPVVGMNDYWADHDDVSRFQARALDVLGELGLAASGTLTEDFRRALGVLASGGQQYSGWFGDVTNAESGGALVSICGDEAILLRREDKLIQLDSVTPQRPVEALLGLLPDVAPARFEPISIPKSQYEPTPAATSESYQFDMATGYDTVSPADRLRQLVGGQRSGVHQFYATSAGRRSAPLSVLDVIGEGRVLTYVSQPAGGEPNITAIPGSTRNLAESLYGARPPLR